MKTLTKDWLQQRHACAESLIWVDSISPVSITQSVKDLKSTKPNWALWIAMREMSSTDCTQLLKYMLDILKDVYDTPYPNSDCYSLTKEQLGNIMKGIRDSCDPLNIFVGMLVHYGFVKKSSDPTFIQNATYEVAEYTLAKRPDLASSIVDYSTTLLEK